MLVEKVKTLWYQLARRACRVFCTVLFRYRVYGSQNVPDKGAFLLICNHQSYLDPLFCGASLKRPLYFLARDSLFATRFFGRLISSVNTIPIKRDQADLSTMKTVIGKLKEGKGVCLFPEATRTSNGKIATLRAGFGLLCRRGEAAVVPVVIDGAFEAWPRHKKLFSPGRQIVVRYGKAITHEQTKQMNNRKLAELFTDTLRRMQTKSRLKQGKKPYNY